jgi:hypothetical protein
VVHPVCFLASSARDEDRSLTPRRYSSGQEVGAVTLNPKPYTLNPNP